MPNISQITPALIGFAIVAIAIILMDNYEFIKNYILKKPVISSLIFISSGFIFQFVYSNRVSIQRFSDSYKSLLSLPPVSIISTILAIFLGNTFLRKIAEHKEKKEIAILFENTIDTHLQTIGFVDSYLSLISCYLSSPENDINIHEIETLKDFINIYIYQVKNDVYYEAAFKKVGIYSENEIDIISLYSSEKQLFISYLERLLIRLSNSINFLKNGTSFIQNDYAEKQFKFILEITIFSLLTTNLFGVLCLCKISEYSTNAKTTKYQETLKQILKELKKLNNLPIISGYIGSCNDFVERLKFVKQKYQSSFDFSKEENEINFYYCLVRLDLGKINEITNQNWEVHVRINNRCILVFGDSEADVKDSAKKKLEVVLKEAGIINLSLTNKKEIDQIIERLMNELHVSIENFSPYAK